MERPTCKTCPYWDLSGSEQTADDGTVYSECRRFPVANCESNSPREERFRDGFWLNTWDYAWCGEHPDFPAYIVSLKVEADRGYVLEHQPQASEADA